MFFSRGFYNNFQIHAEDERIVVLETNTFGWRWTRFVLETNELKTSVRTSATHTQLATSDFQTDLRSRWSLLTSTRLWKWTVSHSRTHLRVYTTSTSYISGLNGLQVNLVDRENDKRTFTYMQLVTSKLVTACNAHGQLSGYGLIIHNMPTQLLHES